jgi:hypothetical protein
MIIYEVTTAIQKPEAKQDWLDWMLREHIQHVVDTGCFTKAEFLEDSESEYRFTVRYFTPDMETLQRYMLEFAPKLRGEFTKRFAGKADISRTIWKQAKTFEPV